MEYFTDSFTAYLLFSIKNSQVDYGKSILEIVYTGKTHLMELVSYDLLLTIILFLLAALVGLLLGLIRNQRRVNHQLLAFKDYSLPEKTSAEEKTNPQESPVHATWQ